VQQYIPKSAYKLRAVKIAATVFTATLVSIGLGGCSRADLIVDYPLPKAITVVSHDSFVFDDSMITAFKKESGITVSVVKAGDAGALTNKLVLTKDQPIGDAVFGIDNTFSGLAISKGIIENDALTAIDFGDVCFNYDIAGLAKRGVQAPTSFRDLVKPAYKDLTVVENPATSSTGLAFLATTVAAFGDNGYQAYWNRLKANGLKVTAGWEDAYYTEFSGSAESTGTRPIVLSYSASPADEVGDQGVSRTKALLNDCFRQTEFAGVLTNAKNPAAAELFVKFLLSETFQKSIAGNMYVYPIVSETVLPKTWTDWASPANSTLGDKLDISASRTKWLANWQAIFG
jgi:thiamine transport system substrate-binding protein